MILKKLANPKNTQIKNTQIKNNIKPSKTTVKRPLKQFDKASSHLNEMLIKQDKKELKQLTTKKNMKADDFTHVKSKEQNSPRPSTQSTPSTGGGIHFHTHHHYSK